MQLAEGRARDAVAARKKVAQPVDELVGDLLLLLRRAVHLEAQDHGQGAGGEGVLGYRGDHIAKGNAPAEESDPSRHSVRDAQAPPTVPAVDLEAASPREQEAAVPGYISAEAAEVSWSPSRKVLCELLIQ